MIKRVNAGDDLNIPAGDYNQMAASAEQVQTWQNSFGVKNPASGAGGNGLMIDGYNYSTTAAMDNFTPVELTEPIPLLSTDDLAFAYGGKRPAFKIKPATEETENFVITQNKIDTESAGPVLLQGITIAQIINSDTDHEYVKVNSDGNLESSSSGSCRILWKIATTGTVWAILQLSSGSDASYKGYFKVIKTAANKLKIVDGMDIEAANCGNVQCNKLATQAITVLELTITQNCYIFRKSVGTFTADVLTSATVTFEALTSFPTYTAGTEYELKSVVTFVDDAITNFSDMPLPYRIDITGACDT